MPGKKLNNTNDTNKSPLDSVLASESRPADYSPHSLPEKSDYYSTVEFAEAWIKLDESESIDVFLSLSQEKRSELITHLTPANQQKLITALSTQGIRELLEVMDPDDLVDLIQSLKLEIRSTVLDNLSDDEEK